MTLSLSPNLYFSTPSSKGDVKQDAATQKATKPFEFDTVANVFETFWTVERLSRKDQILFILARDILSSLAEMHAENIFHRDVKPDHLVVSCDTSSKIEGVRQVLFDNAKYAIQSSDRIITVDDSTEFDPEYASPERCFAKIADGTKVDAWAAGVTLYKIATGKILFPRMSEILNKKAEIETHVKKCLKNKVSKLQNPEFRFLIKGLLTFEQGKRLSPAEALKSMKQMTVSEQDYMALKHCSDFRLLVQNKGLSIEKIRQLVQKKIARLKTILEPDLEPEKKSQAVSLSLTPSA